jgi:hypothetical protein
MGQNEEEKRFLILKLKETNWYDNPCNQLFYAHQQWGNGLAGVIG